MTNMSNTREVLISEKHQMLIAPSDVLTPLDTSAPRLKLNGEEKAVLPHDLKNTSYLRSLGFQVPNPMNLYYEWTGEPFRIQRVTCDLLTSHKRAFVLNKMGTGKTRCGLWAWDYLNKMGVTGKMLVTTPLSTMRFVWENEIFEAVPGRRYSIVYGTKAQRQKALEADADIYIINHDGIGVMEDELLRRPDIDTLIIDELARFRNVNKRSKALRKVAAKMKRVWGFTGSPKPNDARDIWMQCSIVSPERVPKYPSAWRDHVMVRNQWNPYMWEDKPNADALCFEAMQPSVRFTMNDIMELPETVYRDVNVKLTDDQFDLYEAVRKDMLAELANNTIEAVNAAVMGNKLIQIAGGSVYATDGSVVALDASPRLEALEEIIEESDNKVIVFVPFRHLLHQVWSYLQRNNVDVAPPVSGDTSVKDRTSIFNTFQGTSKFRVLVAHPECCSHGVTLTAADTIIWYVPVIGKYEIYEQANARIIRYGQKNKQLILHMEGSAAERAAYRLLQHKGDRQAQFLSMFGE